MSQIVLVYGQSSEKVVKEIEKSEAFSSLRLIDFPTFMEQEISAERVIVTGSIDEIKTILLQGVKHHFEVAILPNTSQTLLQNSFGLSKDVSKNLDIALNNAAKPMDMLFANDELVLHTALLGDAPPLSYHTSKYRNKSFKERLHALYQAYLKIKTMKHTRLKFKTSKSTTFETVATGIVVIEHDNNTFASKLASNSVSTNDTQLDALILSPNSILQYLKLMTYAIFNRKKRANLPSSIGYIKSQELSLESKVPLPVVVDGQEIGTTPVHFSVKPNILNIVLPDSFWEKASEKKTTKETVKLDKLTHSKEKMNYLQKRLPFFAHAAEDQYKTLFSTLRQEAKVNSIFVVLMFFSAVLATVGLYLNSASVVIGAMLLAPLMNPIVALAMALLRQDMKLSVESIKTIVVGVLITLLTAASIAWVLPLEHLTEEMQGRIKPSILDMIVAVVSGAAAGYAKYNSKIASTFAGVAIAVALVPPLATAGIGLGWGDWVMLYQAFLLFLTNLIGIIFAASVIFFIKGFSPLHRAKKGLVYTLVFSLLVMIPLLDSFVTMVKDAQIISRLEHTRFEVNQKQITLQNVSLSRDEKTEVIKCELVLKEIPTNEEMKELKEKIEHHVDKKLELEALIRLHF